MIQAPQRYFVSAGLLMVVAGLAVRALGHDLLAGAGDFVVGALMGAGLTLELVGLLMKKRSN